MARKGQVFAATLALLLSSVAVLIGAVASADSTSCDSTSTGATTTCATAADFTISGSDKYTICGAMSNDVTVLATDPTFIYDAAGSNQAVDEAKLGETAGTGTYLVVYAEKNLTDATDKIVSVAQMSSAVRDAALCLHLTGVDQTTPNDGVDINESASVATTFSTDSTTSAAGDCIVSFYARQSDTTTPTVNAGSGNTLVLAKAVGGGNGFIAVAVDCDGATDTIDWSFGSAAPVSLLTMNVNTAAAAAGGAGHVSVVSGGPF